MKEIKIFAPAKLNWALTIERKRPDGFHDIHTIFQALEWGDELECRAADEPACTIACNEPSVPTGPQNLVARAWARLRGQYPDRVRGLDVNLIKRIPSGAGLGGGSSDAAAALVAVDALYGLGLSGAQLEAHAAAIGSDCPYFLRGGTVLASGRGERMKMIPNHLGPAWVIIVWPGFASPTAAAYGRVTPADWENEAAVMETARALELGDVIFLQKSMKNIFSKLVVSENMKYKKVVDAFVDVGISEPRLSGSGSAMFGLARGEAHALSASRSLAEIFPTAVATVLRQKGVEILPR